MNRLSICAVLVLLVLLAGCIGPFADDDIDDEQLDEPAEYDWDTEFDVDATVDVGEYAVVYHLNGTTSLELSQRGWYTRQPVDVRAVQFRYPNGSTITGSALDISQSSDATEIKVPDGNGSLAFTAPSGSKEVVIPGYVEGDYRVTLPPDHRVGNFFLSDVRPSGYESEIDGDVQILTWQENDDDIYVQFYLERDHYLFYGLMVALSLIAVGGVLYYRRRIRALARRRHEMGLDLSDRRE